MKKFRVITGCLVLTIGLYFIAINTYGQDIKPDKQDRKAAKRAEAAANFEVINSMLVHKDFVVTADVLENRYGDRINVIPGLNFIKVDSVNAVLQTGSGSGIGYNGVGGVTAEGKINRWEIVRNYKTLSYYLHFNIETSLGNYDVSMTLNSDNNVRATITGITPGELIYDGHIEPVHRSGIYKGQNSY